MILKFSLNAQFFITIIQNLVIPIRFDLSFVETFVIGCDKILNFIFQKILQYEFKFYLLTLLLSRIRL